MTDPTIVFWFTIDDIFGKIAKGRMEWAGAQGHNERR